MKKLFPVMMVLALILSFPATAFAAGGTGSGGGNGGGQAEPLTVLSASIEGGGQIAADGSITLVFSKNVCEAGVREANKALVSVKDAQGANVAAVVTLADDQVEPDKKNEMVIGFKQPLSQGAYTLTVKSGVTSKSGDIMAEDYTLAFNVGAADSSKAASASTSEASSGSTSSQQGGFGALPFVLIGALVCVGIVLGVMRSKKSK